MSKPKKKAGSKRNAVYNNQPRMGRWFRFYDDALHDPKIVSLSDHQLAAWVRLLCVASKNGGKLPGMRDIACELRMSTHQVEDVLNDLVECGLIDVDYCTAGEPKFRPHNWDKRQYVSDVADPTAAARMRDYRERGKSASKRNDDRNGDVTVTDFGYGTGAVSVNQEGKTASEGDGDCTGSGLGIGDWEGGDL